MTIESIDRLSAVEAEMSLLGTVLRDPFAFGEVIQILSGAGDFYKPSHADIYSSLLDLYNGKPEFDEVKVIQSLKDRGVLEATGGVDYLEQLIFCASPAHVVDHAKLIADKARIRRLIHAADGIIYRANKLADSADIQLDRAEAELSKVRGTDGSGEYTRFKEISQRSLAALKKKDGSLIGLRTQFDRFNRLTAGLQPGELIVLAARPSMGKSALAINMAKHLAESGIPIGIFSMEMTGDVLWQRIISSATGVEGYRFRQMAISESELESIEQANNRLEDIPLFIDENSEISLLNLRAKVRRMVSKDKVKAIFVDYLQLMNCPGYESRQQEVSQISRGLKALAMELKIPVIALAQLNRNVELRIDKRPQLSDLRESGAIEQDADIVIFIHREDYYRKNDPGYIFTHKTDVLIEKNRNGPTGVVELRFDENSGLFSNPSPFSGMRMPQGVSSGFGEIV